MKALQSSRAMTVRAAIRRIIFAALGAVLAAMFLPAAEAQMRGGFRAPSRGGRAFGSFGGHRRHSVPSGYFLGDTAFLYDDYPFAPAVPEDAPPQFGMLQKLPVEVVPPKIPSLLIELEGDQYVRYGGAAESSHRQVPARQAAASKPSTGREVSSLAGYDLPPTVLVFRDGHREEVVGLCHRGNGDVRAPERRSADRRRSRSHSNLRPGSPRHEKCEPRKWRELRPARWPK